MWFGPGAAVQGRWRGELGDAFTGRKNCWSDRGLGMKSPLNTGGESSRAGGIRGEFEIVCVNWEGGEKGFSKSEQYAESRPREGGVLTDRSRGGVGKLRGMLSGRGAEELMPWRGPHVFSVSEGGGWRAISWGVSLRFREKRFRREDLWRISGAGAAG
jgi:hypothetical protein